MARSKINNVLYQMGIMTLLASLLWASVSVYNALVSPANVEVDSKTLEPIQLDLDIELMKEISGREQLGVVVDSILEGQVVETPPSPTPTPTPTTTPAPPASPSGDVQLSTESGSLE